jgi:ribosome-associated toxin RatA of RatAB toxin-antitoxin module
MHRVERSALVPFPAAAMFDLVADVESYPEFLPGCVAAGVQAQADGTALASLQMQRGPLKADFTTQNRLQPPKEISMVLTQGPFEQLEGSWRFQALGTEGCRITLSLRFRFSNPLKDLLMGAAFETLCNELVDAFVRRARERLP